MRRGDQLEDAKISVVTRRRTDKAVCVERRDGEELWVPLSVCVEDPPADGRRGVLVVKGWWAHQHGLEPDEPAEDEGDDPIVVFNCRAERAVRLRSAEHAAFGTGLVVEDRGDRVVVDFPKPHGRKTVLKDRVVIR